MKPNWNFLLDIDELDINYCNISASSRLESNRSNKFCDNGLSTFLIKHLIALLKLRQDHIHFTAIRSCTQHIQFSVGCLN